MTTFKVGDIVRRIGYDFHCVRVGCIYKISKISLIEGSLTLQDVLDGEKISGSYTIEHFILVDKSELGNNLKIDQISTIIAKINNELNGEI